MTGHASFLTRLAPAFLAPALLVGAASAQGVLTTNDTPPRLFVANASSATVSVVDGATLAVVATVPVGANPQGVEFTLGGEFALVANMTSDSVSVIDTATLGVVATVAVSDAPRSIVATPDGSKAYVGSANGIVDVIDLATYVWSGSIVVGGPYQDSVNGLCVSPDGSRVFALWGNLVAIDTATDTVVASIYAGNTPTSMALSPDGRFAYVASAFGYGPFVFAGALATVDLRSQTVVNSVNLWSIPSTIAISPDGATAFVGNQSTFVSSGYAQGFLPSTWVTRVDLVSHSLDGGFNAGKTAGEMAFSADGEELFVAVPALNHVKVVDSESLALANTIAVGASPRALAFEPVPFVAPARLASPAPKRRR